MSFFNYILDKNNYLIIKMDYCEIETNKGETKENIKFDAIEIKQNNNQYELNIEIKDNMITFIIYEKNKFPTKNYIRKMNFKELINLHKVFNFINSFSDFYKFLKATSDKNSINIKVDTDKISLVFNVEILLEKQIVTIDLYPTKKDIDLDIKEIYLELFNIKKSLDILTSDNQSLKEDNKKLNDEINKLKNENEQLKNKLEEQDKESKKEINDFKKEFRNILKLIRRGINFNESIIMNENEKNIIFPEIEKKMNKKIKELKKLYQATIDGGEPLNFHLNCDNIPNTLILIKSEGQRRFGGFTQIPWKSDENGIFIQDPEHKTFVFSLDNKKIYNLKSNNSNAVYHGKNTGPCFGSESGDISIVGNPIKDYKLCNYKFSYDYKGINDSLSECVFPNYIKAIDYEVFQVIFTAIPQISQAKGIKKKKK